MLNMPQKWHMAFVLLICKDIINHNNFMSILGENSVNESEQRRTLYWNPFVTTDDNGCVTLECQNSSRTTVVGISVEGMCCDQPFSISSLSRQ